MPNAVDFRSAAARHRYSLQYSQAYSAGKRITIPLNNIGYLSELQILLQVAVVVGTGGTVTDTRLAQQGFFPFIGLRSPQGAQVWSTNASDIDAFQFRIFSNTGQSNSTGGARMDPSYVGWTPGTAATYNVVLRYRIPVSGNDGRNFDMGMLMRQISNNQYFLDLQMAQASDLVGAGSAVITSITGTITVEEIYYDAVIQGSNVAEPNFQQFIRLRSLQSQSLQNGQNDIRYDTGPIVCDAFFQIRNNGTGDGTITNLSYIDLEANRGNRIDYRTGLRLAYDNAMHLGEPLPPGWYHEDFWDDMEQINSTLGRDFINSALAAQLDFLVQYAGTPSTSNGPAYIEQFYREIVTLAA